MDFIRKTEEISGAVSAEQNYDYVFLKQDEIPPSCETSSLFPDLPADYFDRMGDIWSRPSEKNCGIYATVRNLNAQGADEMRIEDIKPKPAAEIGFWFKF